VVHDTISITSSEENSISFVSSEHNSSSFSLDDYLVVDISYMTTNSGTAGETPHTRNYHMEHANLLDCDLGGTGYEPHIY